MAQFYYNFTKDGDILRFRATGFTTYHNAVQLVNSIIDEIKNTDKGGNAYKLLFDMRGLRALDPRTTIALGELNKTVYESSAAKVCVIMDNILAKLQQKRLVGDKYDLKEKGFITNEYEKGIDWLKE